MKHRSRVLVGFPHTPITNPSSKDGKCCNSGTVRVLNNRQHVLRPCCNNKPGDMYQNIYQTNHPTVSGYPAYTLLQSLCIKTLVAWIAFLAHFANHSRIRLQDSLSFFRKRSAALFSAPVTYVSYRTWCKFLICYWIFSFLSLLHFKDVVMYRVHQKTSSHKEFGWFFENCGWLSQNSVQ